MTHFSRRIFSVTLALICVHAMFGLTMIGISEGADAPPKVGDAANDFELLSVAGTNVKLADETKKGPVVLIVLRGFPGYQCPICNQQVGQFLAEAEKFKAAGAEVLFVYPGPSKNLAKRAQEFLNNKTIPDHFQLLVDPDYQFTNQYHLRWNAANETAYASTFVIQQDGKITFAKISKTHGDRTSPADVLKELKTNR